MSEPTLYRIDVLADTGGSLEPGAWAQVQVDLLKQRGVLVPVESDPAMLPEDSTNECATETVLKGGTNHCIRPDGHKGSHLAFTYWGAGIGGDYE